MFKFFDDYFHNPLVVKQEDVVGVRNDNKTAGCVIILLSSGHTVQVQGTLFEVINELGLETEN